MTITRKINLMTGIFILILGLALSQAMAENARQVAVETFSTELFEPVDPAVIKKYPRAGFRFFRIRK